MAPRLVVALLVGLVRAGEEGRAGPGRPGMGDLAHPQGLSKAEPGLCNPAWLCSALNGWKEDGTLPGISSLAGALPGISSLAGIESGASDLLKQAAVGPGAAFWYNLEVSPALAAFQ
jgi:hypothetical protein